MTSNNSTVTPLRGELGNNLSKEYLVFQVDSEEYAIELLKVQEIRSYEEPTRLASAPKHILGVQNLRGVIVPILDLRYRLGLTKANYNAATVVIVLKIEASTVGVVVDAVQDVQQLMPTQISEAPTMASSIDSVYITGIGKVEDRLLILLDIVSLLKGEGLAKIDAVADAHTPEEI